MQNNTIQEAFLLNFLNIVVEDLANNNNINSYNIAMIINKYNDIIYEHKNCVLQNGEHLSNFVNMYNLQEHCHTMIGNRTNYIVNSEYFSINNHIQDAMPNAKHRIHLLANYLVNNNELFNKLKQTMVL